MEMDAQNANATSRRDGYISSDSSISSISCWDWPEPPRNDARKRRDCAQTGVAGHAANKPPKKHGEAKQCDRDKENKHPQAGAVDKPPKKKMGGEQCDPDKENKHPQAGQRKKGRSKSLNNALANNFGQGVHQNAGRMRAPSPLGKPMILSKRLSYRINNSTPGKSPITAKKLDFTPVGPMASRQMRVKANRHHQSSLERIGNEGKPPAAKKSKAASKRNSV
jgi:hypothetical protein